MSKIPKKIGIIAEDESDVEAIRELIKRITGKNNIGFKHFVGRGCGKIKRKADDWATQLKKRGCSVLILIHDLDRNKYEDLYDIIHKSIHPFVISKTLINIPTEEMEAWFLADEKGIKSALNLRKAPKKYHHPETIKSPKEVLGNEIEKASNNSKIYLNTKHNLLIAKAIDIDIVKSKCKSFKALHEFVIDSKI
ncbi:hypothetical protein ASG01_14065 [Chryseobacterium sp. Leaf180]|uniref:DUF4276 family protein n=1 Tax=Chryseobacterium sp. Leaf180 TaxID=1736289 RepID=UPI0006F91B30|nr:DUF4276 family protein [Chryseobacterium sp. Leaf180]KQR91492.1 hypothetical protein ASG01_14065 [Chryseobacterium sp. Leaf180]